MLVQKLFKQTRVNPSKPDVGFVPILLIVILIATFGIRLYEWINDGSNAPLLAHTDQFVELSSIADIASHTSTQVILPTTTFEATPYAIGIYPSESKLFSANSVAIVFTKNNERVFEMDVLPNAKQEQAVSSYSTNQHESVVIRTGTEGTFVRVRRDNVVCKHPRDMSHPSFCPFKTILLFEREKTLIRLSVDGDHLSDGELLAIARSIP